jgi:hypothetical protein
MSLDRVWLRCMHFLNCLDWSEDSLDPTAGKKLNDWAALLLFSFVALLLYCSLLVLYCFFFYDLNECLFVIHLKNGFLVNVNTTTDWLTDWLTLTVLYLLLCAVNDTKKKEGRKEEVKVSTSYIDSSLFQNWNKQHW